MQAERMKTESKVDTKQRSPKGLAIARVCRLRGVITPRSS